MSKIEGGNALPMPLMRMTAIERSMGRFMRAPEHGEDGGGQGGGAGDAGGEAGAGGDAGKVPDVFGAGDAGGGQGGGGDQGGGDGGQGGAAPAWAEIFSADAIDADNPSHRDWLAKKGFKDPNDLLKSYRETEKALRSGNKIVVPKEGAPPEDVAAFRTAIGVPEKADGYEIKLPDGVEGELDKGLVTDFLEKAHAAGTPKGATEELAKWYIELQLDANAKDVQQRNAERDAKFAEWGQQKDQNVAFMNRAAAELGLDATAVADIQKGFGAGRTFDLFLRLGKGLAEDAFLPGGARKNFGITSADARVELDRMNADKDLSAKILAGDPATIARRERLMEAIAAEQDRRDRAAA